MRIESQRTPKEAVLSDGQENATARITYLGDKSSIDGETGDQLDRTFVKSDIKVKYTVQKTPIARDQDKSKLLPSSFDLMPRISSQE